MEKSSKEEMYDCLELLKDNPITDIEYYHTCLSNLCDAIITISGNASEFIDDIESAIEKGTIKHTMHYIKWIRERLFQIQTISDVIKEKVSLDDFAELDNLFYYYKKSKVLIEKVPK